MVNKLSGHVVVSPAYGRDYRSASDAKAAFLAGKDFKLESLFGKHQRYGLYCSIRDFAEGASVEVRYSRLTKLTVIRVKEAR